MAFMTAPATAGTATDRMPVLAYDARAGRLSLHDRMQGDDGKWATVKTDVTRAEPTFAVDFGRLEIGFIYFANERAPLWAMAPYGQPAVPEPAAPAATADGKPLRYKPGFRVPVVSRAIGGVREFAGNSAAMIAGMNELHTEFESAPEARAGKLPLVKLADTQEIRSGQSCNYQPIFEIVSWVDRPAALLGPRTVAPPGGTLRPAAQPERIAAPPTRYAPRAGNPEIDAIQTQRLAASRAPSPDAGRWGDNDGWDAPARQLGGGRAAARARF